jgi:hypothetical protein
MMPLMIATEAPQGMPGDLAALAEEQDAVIGDEMAALVPRPERPYSAKVYTALTKPLRSSQGDGAGPHTRELQRTVEEMDADVARFLAMMAAAADDYGKPFPVELGDIKGDSELTAITAALLPGKDKGFAEFLDAPAEPDEVIEEETIMPDGEMEEEEEEDSTSASACGAADGLLKHQGKAGAAVRLRAEAQDRHPKPGRRPTTAPMRVGSWATWCRPLSASSRSPSSTRQVAAGGHTRSTGAASGQPTRHLEGHERADLSAPLR